MWLYCIRHGESVYNAAGRIQGQADIPLSPRGVAQSAALADALAEAQLEAIYASPLVRAAETARPIAERLGLPLVFDDRLREIHAGIFQGLLWSEIEIRHPLEAAQWQAHDPQFVIPGGESRGALANRGQAALQAIREAGHRRAAVVSHGGLLSAAFKLLLEIPLQRTPFTLQNAAITRVIWEQEFRLVSLNETEHLRRVVALETGGSGDLAV